MKKVKKLALNKETLRSLEDENLKLAAGGTSEGNPCVSATNCYISFCICD